MKERSFVLMAVRAKKALRFAQGFLFAEQNI